MKKGKLKKMFISSRGLGGWEGGDSDQKRSEGGISIGVHRKQNNVSKRASFMVFTLFGRTL